MKIALALYFGSYAIAVCWLIWFALAATGILNSSGKIDAWPLALATVTFVSAKVFMRLLTKKANC